MRQSPHHIVKRAKTPTLVIHGELDYRVPATQGLQYYNSLKAKDVAGAARLFPRREPLDPEAAEFAALVPRILRVARTLRAGETAGAGGSESSRQGRGTGDGPDAGTVNAGGRNVAARYLRAFSSRSVLS